MKRVANQSKEISPNPLDVVWGVKAIARVANLTERQASYLLQTGKLPGKKKGKVWFSTISRIREDLSV